MPVPVPLSRPRRSETAASVVVTAVLFQLLVSLVGDLWSIITVDECFGAERTRVYCDGTVQAVAWLLPWFGIVAGLGACAIGRMLRGRGWRHYGSLLWSATMTAPMVLAIVALVARASR